jgi:RNA polymerase sigma factor (sigma-70 family)
LVGIQQKLRKGPEKDTKEEEDSSMPERNPKFARPELSLAALAFRKYAPALHRYIERRVRRPGTALDLTQDIFERFLQIADTDAVRNPQAYLYGIASHVVREALFREDKSLVTYDSDAAAEAGERLDQALPDDMAERLALQQDLKRALAQLPAMHRVVLLLVKRDGLSYEEAARKTRLNVSTVTNYVFEARARVKMLLKDREER